jgi:dolichol-phosphate mannosyltransferase
MQEYDNNKDGIDFSVVIPIYNEEENISELYQRLTRVMKSLGKYEIVMVDDGSNDRSWELIRGLNERGPRVKGIKYFKNFGDHIAITAGLDYL